MKKIEVTKKTVFLFKAVKKSKKQDGLDSAHTGEFLTWTYTHMV